ncbi:MAG: choice-of-anchor C family protein [Betaproteobacteria bacterium]
MIRLTALLGMVLCASAQALPFQNGSFEVGPPPCTFNIAPGDTSIAGWTVTAPGNIDYVTNGCSWAASDGIGSLDLVGSAAGGIGGITQTFDTVPGRAYVLSFDLAGNFGGPPVVKPLAVTINGVTTNFTFDTTGATLLAMGWTRRTVAFTAGGPSSTVTFVSDISGAGGTNAGAALDNVTVAAVVQVSATPVPLPWAHLAALAALALAAAGALSRRRT